MSKKALRPKIAAGFTDSGLPTPDQVEKSVEQIAPPTGKASTGKKAITADDLRAPVTREPGLTNKGRARFTTMLRPDLRQQLETIAANRACSLADVIETILVDYLRDLQE